MRLPLTAAAWATLTAFALAAAPPADPGWPQFLGPAGRGHLGGPAPTAWAEGRNVIWKTPLDGVGWSSPVVAAGCAWVTSAVTAEAGLSLRAVGVDLRTGRVRHDVELFAIDKSAALHQRNTPASPTPAVVGGRVVASFGTHGVACLDAATGKVLWRNRGLKVEYETGAGSSPVPHRGRVILACDGTDAQYVVALDAATGEVAWKTERPAARKRPANERRAFSTPLVISAGGREQVVVPGAQSVYSYDPDTGKELWRVAYAGFSNVPRPVFAEGLVIVSTGYYAHELLAIRPDGEGDVTATHVAWRYKKTVPNVPSPVAVGGRLFMVSDQGTATCLDARTGEAKWSKRLPGNYGASLLARGGVVYAFADDGKAVAFGAEGEYRRVGGGELKGRVQATPAGAGGGFVVRTDAALYLVAQGKGE